MMQVIHKQLMHATQRADPELWGYGTGFRTSHLFPGLPLALSLHTLAPEDCLLAALNPGFLIFMPKGEFWVGAI